jgi:DNA-binding protein HU-beta
MEVGPKIAGGDNMMYNLQVERVVRCAGKPARRLSVADAVGEEIPRKHVRAVFESLVEVGHKELKKNGLFFLHGFAKFVVVKKPARSARKGITRSRSRSRRSPPSPRARQ